MVTEKGRRFIAVEGREIKGETDPCWLLPGTAGPTATGLLKVKGERCLCAIQLAFYPLLLTVGGRVQWPQCSQCTIGGLIKDSFVCRAVLACDTATLRLRLSRQRRMTLGAPVKCAERETFVQYGHVGKANDDDGQRL